MHCCHLSANSQPCTANARHGRRPTFVLLAANLAQEHAPQLLAPVLVLGIVLLDQAVEVALALLVGRHVELLFGRAVPYGPPFDVDDMLPVRLGCEYGPEWRHGLLRHGERRGCAVCAGQRRACGLWRSCEGVFGRVSQPHARRLGLTRLYHRRAALKRVCSLRPRLAAPPFTAQIAVALLCAIRSFWTRASCIDCFTHHHSLLSLPSTPPFPQRLLRQVALANHRPPPFSPLHLSSL